MTEYIADKPSSRPVTKDSVLEYLNREASKAFAALIDRINKLITRLEYAYVAVDDSGAAEIDWSENHTGVLELSQNTTLSFVAPDGRAALLRLLFHQPAAYAVTWPAEVVWAGGSSPDIDGDSTVVLLLYYDGSYYGIATGGGGGGVSDHGALTGLGDDDHSQYLLASGARALAGALSAGGNKITSLGAPTNPNDAARLVDIPVGGSHYDKWNPDAPPASPHADDDECDSGAVDAGWTLWDPSGWLTTDASRGYYSMQITSGANMRTAGYYRPIPDTEFQMVSKVGLEVLNTSSQRVGLFIADDLAADPTGANFRTGNIQGTSITTGFRGETCIFLANNVNATGNSVMANWTHPQYVRMRINGTDFWFDFSQDGLCWIPVYSGALTGANAITPTHCGFFMFTNTGGVDAARASVHWVRFASGAGSSDFFGAPLYGGLTRYLRTP